ncbi:hypothetical protein JCM5350_000757 [Sporobolomyces pararoseus]
MSTSEQTPFIGKCIVCGKESWQRCSKCSSAGLDWMTFCSVECQRVVWYMHKGVCGPRSNPFMFPKLELEEIEESMRLSKLKYRNEEPSTWIKYFQQLDRLPTVEAAEKELRRSMMELTEQVDHSRKQALLLTYRSFAAKTFTLSQKLEGKTVAQVSESILRNHSIDYFAYMLIKLNIHEIQFPDSTNSSWANPLRHLLLVFVAVSVKIMAAPTFDAPEQLTPPFNHIQRFLEEHVDPHHRTISLAVIKFLEDWMMWLVYTSTVNFGR